MGRLARNPLLTAILISAVYFFAFYVKEKIGGNEGYWVGFAIYMAISLVVIYKGFQKDKSRLSDMANKLNQIDKENKS